MFPCGMHEERQEDARKKSSVSKAELRGDDERSGANVGFMIETMRQFHENSETQNDARGVKNEVGQGCSRCRGNIGTNLVTQYMVPT